jgi:hypothetical protein
MHAILFYQNIGAHMYTYEFILLCPLLFTKDLEWFRTLINIRGEAHRGTRSVTNVIAPGVWVDFFSLFIFPFQFYFFCVLFSTSFFLFFFYFLLPFYLYFLFLLFIYLFIYFSVSIFNFFISYFFLYFYFSAYLFLFNKFPS